MSVDHYDAQIDDVLDSLHSDPDVTNEELRDLLLDIAFRCTSAANVLAAKGSGSS